MRNPAPPPQLAQHNESRAFNFGEFINGKAQQPIPPTVAADEPRFAAFADLCRALCTKILTLLGRGLDVSSVPSHPPPPTV